MKTEVLYERLNNIKDEVEMIEIVLMSQPTAHVYEDAEIVKSVLSNLNEAKFRLYYAITELEKVK